MKNKKISFKTFNSNSKSIGFLFIELIVVFCGVFGAFVFDDIKQSKRDTEKAIQICEFYISEVDLMLDRLQFESQNLDTVVNSFLEKYNNKETPDLFFGGLFTTHITTRIWEGFLNSNAIKNLSFNTIKSIDLYVADKTNLVIFAEKGATYYKDIILQNMTSGFDEFYNPQTKELKPAYTWYISFLKNMQRIYHNLIERSIELKKLLEEELVRLRNE